MSSPFFIVGCGRSGTTLVRSILNNGSTIGIPLESLFIADYLNSSNKLETVKILAPQEFEVLEWGLIIDQSNFNDAKSVKCVISKLHELYIEKNGKTRWGQKTPRLVRHWKELSEVYPNSQFIHIVRDPRAVVCSLIKSNVHKSTTYHGIQRWLKDISYGLEMEATLGQDRTLQISFECLTADPAKELRRISAFLNEPYDSKMLDASNKGHEEYSKYYAKIHKRLSSKPDVSRTKAWKAELKNWQISLIQNKCKEFMRKIGYEEIEVRVDYFLGAKEILSKLARVYKFPKQLLHYALYRRGYLKTVLRRKYKLGLIGKTFKINL